MICYKCKFENKNGERACSKCGAMLDYRDIDVKNIDISGLALEEDEDTKQSGAPSKGIASKAIILLVLAAVGVGAAIFVPKYLSQVRAGEIQEVITAARKGVEDYVRANRVWPATANEIRSGLANHLNSGVTVAIKRGVIELSITEEPGKTATISPEIEQGRVKWRCDNGGIGPEYLPVGCYQ